MSALGQKQTFCDAIAMSALPPKAVEIADIAGLDEGRAFLLCPVLQTSTCSAMARASSTSMPRYRVPFYGSVGAWHKADIPSCSAQVRYWG